VIYQGAGIGLHLLTRDFFVTMLQARQNKLHLKSGSARVR
jgi:hypothetical protein